ncbi:MAG: metal-dependent hydrolase [Sphingopyxis sp.]|nr:metal-dependent hydrolase [Sphingopyxis sp.]
MDNLTHSLVGALLGQAGLKRKTALAMPVLIIAANIPDIDAACLFWLDGAEHLAFRRGITHGPLAMLVLPVLLWAVMLGWDRWRRRINAERPAVHRGWLLALAFIGTLSHPAMDWLNTYGVRLLEPFSSRWSYGDSIFIIDVWLWLGLASALWISLRAERKGVTNWSQPAGFAVAVASAYIVTNGVITGLAERSAMAALRSKGIESPLVVASPPPVVFWEREVFWRDDKDYGQIRFSSFSSPAANTEVIPHNAGDPRLAALAAGNSEVRAFLFWSRMPVARFGPDGTLTLTDQRYSHPLAVDRFKVVAKPVADTR